MSSSSTSLLPFLRSLLLFVFLAGFLLLPTFPNWLYSLQKVVVRHRAAFVHLNCFAAVYFELGIPVCIVDVRQVYVVVGVCVSVRESAERNEYPDVGLCCITESLQF